ncbi:MAG: S-methyl-5-thioribose-1-phosphate isomerase [Candidatus Aureabacteria bacterium]|nr:S-methyl-5-thioribose-1-phosphate isomerase [Candidatus Auribacterota bacterium]
MMPIKPIEWRNRQLTILDQTKLPEKEVTLACLKVDDVFQAIRTLQVRGAPLIGVASAYGILVGLLERRKEGSSDLKKDVREIGEYIQSSRPTAVNLEWAVKRMIRRSEEIDQKLEFDDFFREMEKEADAIFREDHDMCEKIGSCGSTLIKDGSALLTHCNAGALATTGLGTALSPMYTAKKEGKTIKVYVDETRPLLQGARLTSFELMRAGIKTILITDSMAASLMQEGKIDLVITGADRIAANGDTANKIGTLNLGILCSYYKIPFYIAAPASTFDFLIGSGKEIPIEERDPAEVTFFAGRRTAPEDVNVFNPAFDVTSHALITGFITNRGIITPPFRENLSQAFSR